MAYVGHTWTMESKKKKRNLTKKILEGNRYNCMLFLPATVICWKSLQTVWAQIRQTLCQAWSGSELFDTLIVTAERYFILNHQMTKKVCSMKGFIMKANWILHFVVSHLGLHYCFGTGLNKFFSDFFIYLLEHIAMIRVINLISL